MFFCFALIVYLSRLLTTTTVKIKMRPIMARRPTLFEDYSKNHETAHT